MQAYANSGANSSVLAYDDSQHDRIIVEFKSGKATHYEYTARSCGQPTVDHLKRLAASGSGLNSFITRRKPGYARKW